MTAPRICSTRTCRSSSTSSSPDTAWLCAKRSCGGTTTIIPFAAQHRGQSLRAVVEAYHERARSRAFVDYGFHLIVSDPTPVVLEEELPGLVADGCPSLKVYMTYDALRTCCGAGQPGRGRFVARTSRLA